MQRTRLHHRHHHHHLSQGGSRRRTPRKRVERSTLSPSPTPTPRGRRRAFRDARAPGPRFGQLFGATTMSRDRKSTRLNSSHTVISYAVFCLKKKKKKKYNNR